MTKAKVFEIFRSVQGEGKYVGVSQVFIRFYECNMHCAWCDTPDAIGDTKQKYQEYGVKELFNHISSIWDGCHSVSLTGGEPLLQKDFIGNFLPFLRKAGVKAYLDTNGILYDQLEELINNIDIIAMDMKMPSSTQCQPYWKEHEEFLKIAIAKDVFIKAVISSATSEEDIIHSAELISRIDSHITVILQPNSFEFKDEVVNKCVEFQKMCTKYLKDVRIIPQLHKVMKVR